MSNEHLLFRQISLPTRRVNRDRENRRPPIGVAAESRGDGVPIAALAPAAAFDTTFPPIITPPVNLTNKGGAIGTADPVQLIFWGPVWNQSSTNPSKGSIVVAVQTILKGPYMSGPRQYGIKPCSFGGALVTIPGPPSTFDDSDVQGLILQLIEGNTFPMPTEARNLFCVFMPPGTTYDPGGACGAHSLLAPTPAKHG